MIYASEKKAHAGGTTPCTTSRTPHCMWSVQEHGFLETQNSYTIGIFDSDSNYNANVPQSDYDIHLNL